MQKHYDFKREKTDTTVSAEELVDIQENIAKLEMKLEAASAKDTSAYRTLKKDLTQLYIRLGDALTSNSKFLNACAAYYRAFELTRNTIAIERLRLGKQNASSSVTSVINKINICDADSDEQAFEYFWHGSQALSGIGLTAPDESRAFAYFKAAAKKHLPSCNMLGVLYHDGRGVVQDYEQAFICFQKAAEQGFAAAQFNLGNMYIVGEGVAQNDEKAFELFLKAAQQEFALAQYTVGCLYLLGQVAPQDNEQVQLWWERYINNIELTQMRDRAKKIITDFFNDNLLKTSPFTKPFMDCLLRAKRLELDITYPKANEIFIVHELLQHLTYTRLKQVIKNMDNKKTSNYFKDGDYFKNLVLFFNQSKWKRLISSLGKNLSKNNKRYRVVNAVLFKLNEDRSNDKLNLDNITPYQLVLIFSKMLGYLKPYIEKKILAEVTIRAWNTENNYVRRLPLEIVEHIVKFGVLSATNSPQATLTPKEGKNILRQLFPNPPPSTNLTQRLKI